MRILSLLLTLTQGLPKAPPEAIGLSSTALARIRPALQKDVDAGKVAGYVALIARRGKVGYLEAVGSMDLAHGTPMRTDAIFAICSMSKPVTSAAVLMLYDRGKLRLDDPVAKYIPAFGKVKVYAGGSSARMKLKDPDRPITIADLLTHTAGLTYGLFSTTPVDTLYQRANLFQARTLQEFVDTLAKLPLVTSPGTEWHYSFAIDVLGRVIEVVSGKSFDRFLEEELFAPLGMRDTGFHYDPGSESRATTMYAMGPDGKLAVAPNFCGQTSWPSGGAGLLSTPGDFLRFSQMLLNGGELEGHRLLKRETAALMFRNKLPQGIPLLPALNLSQGGYGFGYGGAVLVDSAASGMAASPGTFRWWGYAETYFWIDPRRGLVALLFAQFLPGNPTVPLEFQRLVYAALGRAP